MNLFQIFRIALLALAKNRMRSFLTALGVVIGVAAVIAMVAIGDGAKAKVEASFSSMGANLLIVMSGSSKSGGMRGGAGSLPSLTWDDLRAIQQIPSVANAAPLLRTGGQVAGEELNWGTSIQGVTPAYFTIRDWKIDEGSLFSPSDVDGGAKVVVLGRTVVNKVFGANADVIGKTVRIKNVPFEIVGVLESKGQSAYGHDNDDAVFIPSSTFLTRIQGGLQKYISGTVFVAARAHIGTVRAEKDIEALLRQRHRIQGEGNDDFSIRNLSEMAAARQEGTETLTALLASIALVSLVVGGIGIMNIMLVSVTERTREIGLRMAVGAKPGDVLAQFLIEALVLSLAGGVIGIALGLFTAYRLTEKFGWPMLVRPEIIGVTVIFSAIVGIVFGLYPAQKASRLDPIQALRYE